MMGMEQFQGTRTFAARLCGRAERLWRLTLCDRPVRRLIALVLVVLMIQDQGSLLWQSLRAETGGATAPEVTKFEPVNTTDLVNLASGDFAYTIPVINVPGPEGGYPLALSYHAGIQHGEDASWVGLGWNLQPGSISRAVRGYPDDFKGVGIDTNYRSNVYETYSVGVTFCFIEAGVSYTSFKGFGGSIGLSVGVGVYAGPFSASASVGVSVNFAPGGGVSYTASANASVSGPGFSAGLNASMDLASGGVSLSKNAGVSLNLDSFKRSGSGPTSTQTNLSEAASSLATKNDFGGASGSFGSYSGGGQHSQTIGIGFSIGVVGIHASYTRSWLDKTDTEKAYGYYYHTEINAEDERVNEWTMESDPAAMRDDSEKHALASGLHYLPSNDGYAVMAEGTGGGLKLTRGEDRVYRPRRVVKDKWDEGRDWPWGTETPVPAKFKPRFVFLGDNTESIQPDYVGMDQVGFKSLLNQRLAESQRLSLGDLDALQQLVLGKTFKKGSRFVKESLDGSGHFAAFDVWETDGKRYTFGEPVWHWESESLSANKQDLVGEWLRSKVNNPGNYAYAWYLSELKYPDYWDADEDGKLSDGDHGGWVRFSYALAANRYKWSSSVDGRMNDGPVNRIDALGKDKAGMMFSMQSGFKQIKYLSRIETATHVAHFVTSPRKDGQQIGGSTTPLSIGTVSGNSGTYTLSTSSDGLERLGVQLNFADAVWHVDASDVHTVTSGICEGELTGTETSTYLGTSVTMVLNGVPVKTAAIRRSRTFAAGASHPGPQTPTPLKAKLEADGKRALSDQEPPVCETSVTTRFEVQILRKDQFWGDPVSQEGFRDLARQWDEQVVGKPALVSDGAMQRLDDIYLVEKATGQVVKQVHFDYTYELQQGVPNSSGGGKLTLKAVWTYGRDGKAGSAVLPPYRFEYAFNPAWGDKYKYDRWGFYKRDGGLWNHRDVNGDDQAAWSLTRVTLPSGGTLDVQYEPKDYTYVQDRIPQNSRAYAAQDVSYTVDMEAWLQEATQDPDPSLQLPTGWPVSPEEWEIFRRRVQLRPLKVLGTVDLSQTALKKTASISQSKANGRIPIESAPNPVDLKRHYAVKALKEKGSSQSIAAKKWLADLAPQTKAAATVAAAAVDRMVMLRMGYNSSPDENRKDVLHRAALVHLASTSSGADLTVTDPAMLWPARPPATMTVSWNRAQATPKLGGGVRVKRIISFDGQRRYTTGYSYTDFVDGVWTSSGVAAQEPPPFGFSLQDDRVIQTEKGGWANEGGGGITHSRVIVRHSWTDDPYPAGVQPIQRGGNAQRVSTPMGETVYRFLSPRDLPHFQREAEFVNTVRANGKVMTNSVRMTEIFNVGSWWGQLLWREDRDALGRPLTRTENRFTQLEGYLRALPVGMSAGTDEDRERLGGNAPRPDMTYSWSGDPALGNTLPRLVERNPAHPEGTVGQSFPSDSPGYLNASINVTVMNAQTSSTTRVITSRDTVTPTLSQQVQNNRRSLWMGDDPPEREVVETGWHSSLVGVREISLAPLISEVRTYGEGLRLLTVLRHTRFDRRTGASLETWQRGRRVETVPSSERSTEMIPNPRGGQSLPFIRNRFEKDGGDPFNYHEKIVNRIWPAYWVYPAMDQDPEPDQAIAGWNPPVKGFGHALSQIAQRTTLRISPTGAETFLNSKIDTWQQPEDVDRKPGAWFKGGEFVWNGMGTGAAPPVFGEASSPRWGWTPKDLDSGSGSWASRVQPFKDANWLMAGATTIYDAFAHALEAIDGDGVFGCSVYGYPYGEATLPAGNLPIAKFGNARYQEVRYYNFEDPKGRQVGAPACNRRSDDADPRVRLATAYTGGGAYFGTHTFGIPAAPSGMADEGYEFRAFVKVATASAAEGALSGAAIHWKKAVPAEGGWWLLRARVDSGATATLSNVLMDDVSIFPWRRNGAPVSISHFTYDPTCGLVTSITGSNGRTTRYRYDGLGRLIATYDPYGQASSATQYRHAAQQ
ncbi:RHS repeat domain-containing protein [Geothrix sp. 21YS21S-4]|uniref:RHS repeat domain-containing protein n=1 Tax=Geothrix sp. 21YS21S-4 TaxID=3068889 RepID=UPI0027BA03CD|nr:RHS repeat domain-containing protein [Geothrix sp. 21YS21S-4]